MPMKSIVVVWDGVQCTMDPASTHPLPLKRFGRVRVDLVRGTAVLLQLAINTGTPPKGLKVLTGPRVTHVGYTGNTIDK